MTNFEDMEAVEEWLDPLDYEEFWREMAQFDAELPSRTYCEDSIAGGVERATVLFVLKGLARLHIVEEQGLKPRITTRQLH